MRVTILSSVSALVLLAMMPQPAVAAFEFVAPKAASSTSSASAAPVIRYEPQENAAHAVPSASDMVKGALQPVMISPDQAGIANDRNEEIVEAPLRVPPRMDAARQPDRLLDAPPALPDIAAPQPRIHAEIQELPPLPPVAPALPDPVMARNPAPVAVPAPAPVPAPAYAPVVTAAASPDTVQGFARDVPLVLALQQIAPPQYRYAFDNGINPGMRISWSGGKSWQAVVEDIARQNHMRVEIAGHVIAFHRDAAPVPVMPAPSYAPPVAPVIAAAPAPQPHISSDFADSAMAPLGAAPLMPTTQTATAPVAPSRVADDLRVPPVLNAPIPAPQPRRRRVSVAPTTTTAMPQNIINQDRLMDLISDAPSTAPVTSASVAPSAMPAPSLPVIEYAPSAPAIPAPYVTAETMPAPSVHVPVVTMDPLPVAPSHEAPVIASTPQQLVPQLPEYSAHVVAPQQHSEPRHNIVVIPESLPDTDKPARSRVEDKQILTADGDLAMMALTEIQDVPSSFDIPMPLMPPASLPDHPAPPPPRGLPPVQPRALLASPSEIGPVTASQQPLAGLPDMAVSAPVTASADMNNMALTSLPYQSGYSVDPLASGLVDGPRSSSYAPPVSTPVVAVPPLYTTVDTQSTREWVAYKGETLRQALTNWSGQAGVSLVWSSAYDYPLQTDIRMDSVNYAEAVRTLLTGFAHAAPRPFGRLYNNSKAGAQPVLVIDTQALTK